jgi:hypothetical protein
MSTYSIALELVVEADTEDAATGIVVEITDYAEGVDGYTGYRWRGVRNETEEALERLANP